MSKRKGFLDFLFSGHITGIHIAASQNMTEVFPAQMFHQMVVIENDIVKSMSLRNHEKR